MSRLSRRSAIVRLLAAAAAPLGLQALAQLDPARAFAQEAPPVAGSGEAAEPPAAPRPLEDGHYFYSLQGPEDGPLSTGPTRNSYGTEIGYATFDSGTFLIHHNYDRHLLSAEWIASRIGAFSIKDGAILVEALGELNDQGCFALELRHQAYKDRRYIRANWLSLDPPTGTVAIGTDGIWGEMDNVARAVGVEAVRPPGEWNTFLFTAQGSHFEGWVNGVKAVEGEDDHFGAGRISLITMRMNKAPYQVRFRNLHIWDGAPPDPTTLWS